MLDYVPCVNYLMSAVVEILLLNSSNISFRDVVIYKGRILGSSTSHAWLLTIGWRWSGDDQKLWFTER